MLMVVAALAAACLASAAPAPVITFAGASLRLPPGWHAAIAPTPSCDPRRLIVASSAPLHITASGTIRPPARGEVMLLLLEDVQVVDRPAHAPPRAQRFTVRWHELRRLKPYCGNPRLASFMTWFRTRGRYLGYIVYPNGNVMPATRASTLMAMNSLRVTP